MAIAPNPRKTAPPATPAPTGEAAQLDDVPPDEGVAPPSASVTAWLLPPELVVPLLPDSVVAPLATPLVAWLAPFAELDAALALPEPVP